MKLTICILALVSLASCKSLSPRPRLHYYGSEHDLNTYNNPKRCANMWDDGCINDQIYGAGGDDYYLNGAFNPGKRCANVWDDGCINGQMTGGGNDDYYLNGAFNPGKRCANVWDEGCSNGQLPGSGEDDYYLNGSFNPGKRSLQNLLDNIRKQQQSKTNNVI